jgi:hypothetical protein
MNITPEVRPAIEQSGPEPLGLEDPLGPEANVFLTASACERIERLLAPLINARGDWQSADVYAAGNEASREGWESPGMSG